MTDTRVHGCRFAQGVTKLHLKFSAQNKAYSRCLELLCCRNWLGPACLKCSVQSGCFSAYVSTAFRFVVDLTKCRIC